MPPPSKKRRLARSQRPAGSTSFTAGILEDIESIQVDPDFIPDIEDSDRDIGDGLGDLFGDDEDSVASDSSVEDAESYQSMDFDDGIWMPTGVSITFEHAYYVHPD